MLWLGFTEKRLLHINCCFGVKSSAQFDYNCKNEALKQMAHLAQHNLVTAASTFKPKWKGQTKQSMLGFIKLAY